MLNYKLTNLDNGLRIITAPLENTKATSLFILVGSGSRSENKKNNGIAHFLEHMFFKGTKKRPKTIDIARDLDGVGASFNAFTGEEYTGFYVRVESKHFDLALDVLTDMLFNSKFSDEEITKEKGVILEEINMIKDLPQAYVENVLHDLLYGDTPLGRMITGTTETIKNMTRNDFIDFKNSNYLAENMIVAVAGGTDGNWEDKITKIFSKLAKKMIKNVEKITENQSAPQVKLFSKTTDQAHFIMGFRGLKRTDPRRPVLKVLNNIMGATMSSRLFIEVREKRGLCYYVNSNMIDFSDTGFWAVSAGVDIKRIEEAIKVILGEFEKVKNIKVTAEELSRAKENLRGHFYLGLEESMNVAQFLAEQELFWKKIKDPDAVVAETDKVSKEDVLKLAKEIMKPENLNLAIVGPFKNDKPFENILNQYK